MPETCITATLIRGKKYSFNHVLKRDSMGGVALSDQRFYAFERNIPLPIPEEVADALEDLVDISTDPDGDEIEKPFFRVDRNAQIRRVDDGTPKKVRMRLVAADEVRAEIRPKPKPRGLTTTKARGLYDRRIG